jgi:hypothetical protein
MILFSFSLPKRQNITVSLRISDRYEQLAMRTCSIQAEHETSMGNKSPTLQRILSPLNHSLQIGQNVTSYGQSSYDKTRKSGSLQSPSKESSFSNRQFESQFALQCSDDVESSCLDFIAREIVGYDGRQVRCHAMVARRDERLRQGCCVGYLLFARLQYPFVHRETRYISVLILASGKMDGEY